MAKYSIEIKRSAQRELDAIDNATFARIDRTILAPAEDPCPAGCKKLKGYKDHWRVRIGDWRLVYTILVYTINNTTKRVTIARVAHRREVYE